MTARRSALALVLSAAVTALAAAPAPARAQRASSHAGASRLAILVGMEDDEGPAGFQLRGDLETAPRPISPAISFSVVGSLGYSRFHDEATDLFFGERIEASVNLLRVIPAARLSFGAHPAFRPYLDGGLGLYFGSWESEFQDLFSGFTFQDDGSEVGLVLRLAAGATFQVSPTFALGAELGILPYLGDRVSDTMTSLLASATFRM